MIAPGVCRSAAAGRNGIMLLYTRRMLCQRIQTVLLAIVAVLVGGCSVISVDLSPRIRPLTEETVEGKSGPKILLMDVSGMLSDEGTTPILSLGNPPARVPMLVRIREELKKAEEDRLVRALIVRINSPGGTVTASDIVFREIQTFKQRTHLPVLAVLMDVAASGGYYVALAADTIVAHPTTVTGSIGTIMISVNAEGLMQKLGVAATAIKSAEHKDMGSPFRQLTAEERGIFQSIINDMQGQFVAKVVANRKLSPETARKLADGRVYTAEQALAHKLVDQIGYMSDVVTLAKRAAGVDEARVVVYHRPRQYRATYYARTDDTPLAGLDASLSGLASIAASGPRFLYLWWP
jgi:protease-4